MGGKRVSIMNYSRALRWISRLKPWYIRPGLKRIRAILSEMENPEKKFPSVLVAGTNGKGSVCAIISAVLREAGYRVGVYTSPHLVSVRERIKVGNAVVSAKEFSRIIERIKSAEKKRRVKPTYFEVLTAAGFLYFAKRKIDIAVAEVGMGGAWDATNVLDPMISVLTNVELDHTRWLGATRAKIARDKVGVARSGRSLITGNIAPSAFREIKRFCKKIGAQIAPADKICKIGEKDGEIFAIASKERYEGLTLPLKGKHQLENLAIALAALILLRKKFPWTKKDLKNGFLRVCHRGRLELIRKNPDTYMDGAHNLASAVVVADYFQNFPKRPKILVAGIASDKNVRGMLKRWGKIFDCVITTQTANPRLVRARKLAQIARTANFKKVFWEPDPIRAVNKATRLAGGDGTVCVAGSLFLAGEVFKRLKIINLK